MSKLEFQNEMKQYVKKLQALIDKKKQSSFMQGASEFVQTVLANFTDYQVWSGPTEVYVTFS